MMKIILQFMNCCSKKTSVAVAYQGECVDREYIGLVLSFLVLSIALLGQLNFSVID